MRGSPCTYILWTNYKVLFVQTLMNVEHILCKRIRSRKHSFKILLGSRLLVIGVYSSNFDLCYGILNVSCPFLESNDWAVACKYYRTGALGWFNTSSGRPSCWPILLIRKILICFLETNFDEPASTACIDIL